MPNYLRAFVPGVFTANLLNGWSTLLADKLEEPREATRRTQQRYPIRSGTGLVQRVADWPRSSFHRDVCAGIFPHDWAGEIETLGEFGEGALL